MRSFSYSSLEQHLHKQFLGKTDISNFLFDRIKRFDNNNNNILKVFITGLARTGTTALLNKLYSSQEFASLKYSHMPFVLSPRLSNLFSKLSKDNSSKEIERIHKDGIKISVNSPECLDEPFWIKENKNYHLESISSKRNYTKDILISYQKFLNRHCIFQGKDKFLIKNNNNHLRITQLCDFFKNDIFIILYRDPISQSISLLNTHKRICNIQKKDPFVLTYMNLIGHREFGLNQIPFHYNSQKFEIKKISDAKENLNYWLKTWINAYSWIYEYVKSKKPKNLVLVSYEEICEPESIKLNKIFNKVKLNSNANFQLLNKNNYNSKNFELDNELLTYANQIYSKLTDFK